MEQDFQIKFKGVIATLGEHFSSHDFIKAFCARYEKDYLKWCNESSLQKTNAKIGRLLVKNQKALGIEKEELVESETFHGTIVKVQEWKKVILTLLLVLMSSVTSFGQDFVNPFGDWKWIYLEKGNKHSAEYPVRMTYYTYESHPQYKIVDKAVYDEKGTLKCILPIYVGAEVSSEIETVLAEKSESDFQEKVKSTANEIIKSFPIPANFAFPSGSESTVQRCYKNIISNLEKGIYGRCALFKLVKIKKTKSNGNVIGNLLAKKIGALYNPVNLKKTEAYENVIKKFKEKDWAFLNNYADSINSHNKHWKFHVEKEYDEYASLTVARIYVDIHSDAASKQPVTDEQRLQAEAEVLKSLVEKAKFNDEVQKDAKKALELSLCVSDYKSNKYAVNKEPQKVRIKIEEYLGLRRDDEKNKAEANEFLQSFCKNAGIKYTPGMTKDEFEAAYVKKHGKSNYQLFNQVAATMQDYYKKALFGIVMESADENSKTAYRYINQLKEDNSKWTENLMTISRVNDTSFRLKYGSEDKKSVIVKYYSEKPFTCTYRVVVE